MAGIAALVCFLSCRSASADVLELEADASGCPSRAAFLASVRARTELSRFDGTEGRVFVVTLRTVPGAEPYAGTLVVQIAGGLRSTRQVEGVSCTEVAEALSLIVALTIDPNARVAPEPTPEAEPTPRAATPPPAERREAKPLARKPTPDDPSAQRLATRLTVEATSAVGPAPAAMLGAAIDLGLRRREGPPGVHSSFDAHVRVEVEKTVFNRSGQVTADFVRSTATFALCPLSIAASRLVLAPCGGFSAGAVRIEGRGVAEPSSKVRFWSHVEAAVCGEIDLGSSVYLRLRAAAEVPLTRDELVVVRPDVFVHRAAAIGGTAAVGLGFWL